ncbi:MAG: hypothetical protein SPG64_00260 [Candidatus Enteromonas sp.]|nr:hypothetical protein [Candidatus Enteromonas sp.]
MKRYGPCSGVIYSKGAILLCRKIGADGYPESGFHLLHGSDETFQTLHDEVQNEFKGSLTLIHDEGNFPLGDKQVNRVFLVREKSALSFPHRYEVKFLHEFQMDSVYLESKTRKILTRFFALRFYYLGFLSNAYDAESAKTATILLSCLRYFAAKGTLPKSEVRLFEDMTSKFAPVKDLRKAFRYFLSFYDLDVNEWKERMEIDHSRVK